MRLIDADRLKAAIHTDFSEHFTLYHDTDQTALFDMVMDDIDEMPTAFDKEKVIEKIKEIMNDESIRFVDQAVNRTIEIVEKGWNSCIDAITGKK